MLVVYSSLVQQIPTYHSDNKLLPRCFAPSFSAVVSHQQVHQALDLALRGRTKTAVVEEEHTHFSR